MLPQKIGRYEIKGILGQGGFGVVYHAYDPNFEQDVALKQFRLLGPMPGLEDDDALRLFHREARIVRSLHHPAIVPVFDFDKEGAFIVMPLMEGGSLKPRLAKGPLALHEIVRILESLALALDKVHRRKIIHRDLKPSNILFDEDDRPYIADFGLAKLTEATKRYAFNTNGLGTAHYMSPEQARGDEKLDGRCDLYSLGATLFEMLTGKPPYHKVHPAALVHFHMNEPIPRLDELRTDLPAGSQAVIDRAMAKKADDRYASAGELVEALKALLEDADEYVRRANRSYSLRQLDQAILQYSEALRIKPDHALAYFGRASAYHDKGLLEAAIADYTQVLKLTPHYMAAYFRRAQAYEQKGQHELVIADYSQLLRIKSDHALAYLGRGNAYIATGKVELAIVDHSYALRLSPHLAKESQLNHVPPKERAAAGIRLAKMGDPRPSVMTVERMEFCLVPAGPFWMGSEAKEARDDEKPLHQVDIPYAYWMSRYPITNAQYQQFMDDGGYAEEKFWPEAKAAGEWKEGQVGWTWEDNPRDRPYYHDRQPFNLPNHPVVGVNWYEALAFTRWLTERLGSQIGLPSEAEWEKAARGGLMIPATPLIRPANTRGRGGAPAGHDKGAHPQGMIRGRNGNGNDCSAFSVPQGLTMITNPLPQRRYPWGDDVEEGRVNDKNSGIGHTNAVGGFIGDKSPYGCEELIGNIWEWTRSLYQPYPYQLHDKREKLDVSLYTYRTLKGSSSIYTSTISVGCSLRCRSNPSHRINSYGFRVFGPPSL